VEEIVGLSGQERDRLVSLRQVKEGKLTQRKAAEQLGLSSRWIRKLMKRLRREGDRGFWHGDPAKKNAVRPVTPVALGAPSVKRRST
jgi:predicted ArsR family transcriptional regulator